MKKKKHSPIFSILYIVGVTILAIVLIGLFDSDIKDLPSALAQFDMWWLVACIGSLLLYWLTDALLLHDITSYMYKRVPLLRSIKVGIIGLYYGALTPFATGGQPMQVIYMRRNEIPVGTSTCIVCIKFVVYELSLCAFYVGAMIIRGGYFYSNNNQVFWLTTLGFVFNLLAVVFVILTITNKKLVMKFGGGIIRLFSKLKIVKKKDKMLDNFEKTIDDYHTAAAYISKYKLRAIGSFFVSIINLGFFFVIPFLIYRAFGQTQYNILDIITMQAFLYLAVSFFPMPGAAGAAEGGFVLFFKTIFASVGIGYAMLMWRFLTYYLIVIVGSILVVLEEVFIIRRSKKDINKK